MGVLSGVLGGTAGDAQADTVILNGTNGNDIIDVFGAGNSAAVVGLPALVNIARMLRPGGSLLSNQAVVPIHPMKSAVGQTRVAYSDRQHDAIFWYERQ